MIKPARFPFIIKIKNSEKTSSRGYFAYRDTYQQAIDSAKEYAEKLLGNYGQGYTYEICPLN